jgi:hypothetical protein
MPIHIDVFHPSRLVIAVVRGAITADEVRDTVLKFMDSDVLHYRKIIDIGSPTLALDKAGVEAVANLVLAQSGGKPRGPLAFVVNPGQAADNAGVFAKLTEGERPVKVFQSLHQARKWLDEQAPSTILG